MVMLACVSITAIPWLMFLRGRIGSLASLALIALAAPAILIVVMIGARATGTPLLASILGALILGFASGAPLAWHSRPQLRGAHVASLRQVLPAGLGALVALATFLAATLIPGASRVSWAMLGDSASHLERARLVITAGGVALSSKTTPVPLASAMVAAEAAPWRPLTGKGAILAHDLSAYASTWSALIVLSCGLAGAVAYAVVERSPQLAGTPARLTVAAASLLPLGWFWTGYPIKFGFINAHVVFVILLTSVLAYLSTLRRPTLGFAMQLVAVVLTLLTWSPLALLPGALALTQAVHALGSFARRSRTAQFVVLAGATIGMGVATWLGSRMLGGARGSLSIPGGLAEFPKPMLPAAAVLLVALTLAASKGSRGHRLDRTQAGFLAVAGASVIGLAMVVVLSGTASGPWSYYPHKYAWIASAVMLTLALPEGICAAARLRSAPLRASVYGAGALGVAVSLGLGSWWAPGNVHFLRDSLPYVILVEDNLPDDGQPADTVAHEVVSHVDLARLTIPWNSSLANDYRVAFWLIHLQTEDASRRGDDAAAYGLWTLANFHYTPDDLCALAALVPQGLTVQTANGDLAAQMQALCPAADVIVEGDVRVNR